MITYQIYFQDYEEQVPALMAIDVKNSQINWNDDYLQVPVPMQPFEMFSIDDIDCDALNLSITLRELTVNKSKNHFGIDLDLLKFRLNEQSIPTDNISNLMIRLNDLEELILVSL